MSRRRPPVASAPCRLTVTRSTTHPWPAPTPVRRDARTEVPPTSRGRHQRWPVDDTRRRLQPASRHGGLRQPSHGSIGSSTARSPTRRRPTTTARAFSYRTATASASVALRLSHADGPGAQRSADIHAWPDPPVAGEDSGIRTITGFLTGIDPGPADEGGQTATVCPPRRRQPAPLRPAAGDQLERHADVQAGRQPDRLVAGDGQRARRRRYGQRRRRHRRADLPITVAGTNDPPTANSDSYGTDPGDDGPRIEAGVATPLDVLANDFTLPDVGRDDDHRVGHEARPWHGHHRCRQGRS